MSPNFPISLALIAVTLCAVRVLADSGQEPITKHAHTEIDVAFGSPGQEGEVTRIIHVQAMDPFRFVFDQTDIRQGDVVKFVVTNGGKMRHEFSIGDVPYQRAHAAMMKKMPNMVHNDPNMATLEPGETKTLIWKFDKAVSTDLVFACHERGHYEAGMILRTKLLKENK